MKNKNTFLILLVFSIWSFALSQNLPKDSIYGNIKKIKEKVLFLTQQENPKLFHNDDDYGHSGFRGPEPTIARFYSTWYSTNFCYYLNHERHFDIKRKIIKDIWFGKKNNFIESYRYLYDKKGRLISKIDSLKHSVTNENHYFDEYGDNVDENIIYENLRLNLFIHNYKKYKNGKITITKKFHYNGSADEYVNHYNDKGKLSYVIYKNPNNWEKSGNGWTYGIKDSVGVTYKSLINEYDSNNKLIKTQSFDLFSDENYKNPVETRQTIFKYQGDNLITKIESSKNFKALSYVNYKYEKNSKLIEEYCCDEDISKAKLIKKYFYNNDKIVKLNYTEQSFNSQTIIHHKILYTYKYDDNKNWVEMIKTVNGVDLYKWVREIEYY
ncbi:hypothetical protein [Flavobacterium limi]|uniref:YD repeat-containing protein n=1 Tax=Flavobacterium limi TaxID=2045105 RepID=A0ABQ1UDD0_9FLAO|nr:hypothetical protein [Flavobacterium limi]GGF16372.1 hypothetical protein GCM10011518_27220 [Flavobacterium limi]